MNRYQAWSASLLILAGCRTDTASISEEEAVDIANEHVVEFLPTLADVMDRFDVDATSSNGLWVITYSPPPGSTGGPLSVEVDKVRGSVVRGIPGPNYTKGD